MTSRVWIVRHGNTFDKGDTVTRVGGRTDLPLSLSGQLQAGELALYFDLAVPTFETALCSPLQRTRDTARAILEGREGLALEEAEFLREVDYGPDENQPEDKVVSRIGQEALEAWEERAVVPSGWEVDPDAIQQGWRDYFDRVKTVSGDHLVVTSNGIARFALILLGQESGRTLKLPTGGYGLISFTENSGGVVEWGLRPGR